MTPQFRTSSLALAAAVAIALALISACAREGADTDQSAAATDTGTAASGMQGTEGMEGMGGAGGMMERMQVHMRMMDSAGPSSMQAMLPMHRQMVANMISQFNREMRQMNMNADAAWQATIDSLRQDNIRMPEMSATELRAFMPEHRARVMRLMDMHRAMMKNMKM